MREAVSRRITLCFDKRATTSPADRITSGACDDDGAIGSAFRWADRDLRDNPMGTDGFEFVEYIGPDPQALAALFEA
jgi:hypothetical protein